MPIMPVAKTARLGRIGMCMGSGDNDGDRRASARGIIDRHPVSCMARYCFRGIPNMPEYLAPGVYVEEVPSSPKPIQGVDTSSTGFVGAAASGPPDTAIGPLGRLAEFEAQFGDGKMLVCAGKPPAPAFLWHAARAFFDEGGTDLYVVRVSRAGTADGQPQASDFERGLSALDEVPSVAMIAAPGSTFDETGDSYDEALTITSALIAYAERMRDRMAVIDTPNGQSVDQARKWRSNFASSFASLHF